MRESLTRDYTTMIGIALGDPPFIDQILRDIDSLERVINA